ncbi:hypothetical protein N7474_009251 [Penicillium riverlandense]|uniref:uncharacterized protein n=1 Tax=Penicillium riverlandense TaxID=1903569 RepID=UPI002548C0BE|nr:uncharacterized protein N7474_009251 [Penicillium riverlandense]KAJ5807982.1 hypothetical protein N7474_009251 [Penicillium riverlandense]
MGLLLGSDGLAWTTKLGWLLVSSAAGILTALMAALVPYSWASQRPKNFPPGPKPVPFLGNLKLIPPSKSFALSVTLPPVDTAVRPYNRAQIRTSKRRGVESLERCSGVSQGPYAFGLLLTLVLIWRLLEKRSAIYSSRPPNYIANELICKNQTHILFTPYGSSWKTLRKCAQGLFVPRGLASVHPIQQAEATQTAYDILREPGRYYEHIQRYTTAVILASVYGQRGETFDSPNVQALYDVQNRFTALLEPGAAPPVDGITFLQHVPEFMAPWKQRAKQVRRDQREIYFRLYNATKERMARGIRVGCFMEKLIEDQAKNQLDDEHTTYLGGILMEAGSDTTSSTLLSFLLAMLENPVALKRAQEDVDRVCDVKRSPTISDLDNLPYIEACMHEVHTELCGIPHMLTQEDSYKGYVFPAGTIFFANTWAIHHDENEYDDPTQTSYGWGAGRRICSGQKLAEFSLKINIAKMVWAFDIERDTAASPPDMSVETGYEGGFLVCPKKFPLKITPRSESHAATIKSEFEGMEGFYERFAA